jgi:MFS family permease
VTAQDPPASRRLPRPVWLLGWTSFFTDTATEAIYPLLPLFLTRVLNAGAVSLGIVEGAAEATASVLKILSGRASDRWKVRRPIVIAGYGVSSAVRPFIGLATSWLHVLTIRMADRVGKGVRGAPRDALLAAWAPPGGRGYVFGFHQAMDHAGAVLGPLLATAWLLAFPENYRTLFGLTAIPGAIAVGMLFFVPERRADATPQAPVTTKNAASPARDRLPRSFYLYLVVVLVFSLGNSTDTFLLLRLSQVGVGAAAIPLLWALLHVVKASLSTLGGSLSDRWSRRGVIGLGWGIYAVVYGGFAVTTSTRGLITWFLIYGLYYALTGGASKALVVDLVPPALRGYAFGLHDAALGFGALLASVVFGVVWKLFGAPAAFMLGAALSLVAAAGLLAIPRRSAPADGSSPLV